MLRENNDNNEEEEETEAEKYDEWAVAANEFNYDGLAMAREILDLRGAMDRISGSLKRKNRLLREVEQNNGS